MFLVRGLTITCPPHAPWFSCSTHAQGKKLSFYHEKHSSIFNQNDHLSPWTGAVLVSTPCPSPGPLQHSVFLLHLVKAKKPFPQGRRVGMFPIFFLSTDRWGVLRLRKFHFNCLDSTAAETFTYAFDSACLDYHNLLSGISVS